MCTAPYVKRRSTAYPAAGGLIGLGAVLGLGNVAAACEAPPAAGDSGEAVAEPESGALFPKVLLDGEKLIAAGVRLMTPLKVQVYALGLYLDAPLASALLARWYDATADEILNDKEFWEKLSSPSSTLKRTVRMVTVREVSGHHMQTGFNRGLAWRVKLMSKKTRLEGGKQALREFNNAFRDAGILKVGTEVLVRCLGHGKIQVCIQGRPSVDIDSPVLVWSILQMFYGEKSVAPNVKERVAAGFAALFRSE
jgi:Chalcone isomerase like